MPARIFVAGAPRAGRQRTNSPTPADGIAKGEVVIIADTSAVFSYAEADTEHGDGAEYAVENQLAPIDEFWTPVLRHPQCRITGIEAGTGGATFEQFENVFWDVATHQPAKAGPFIGTALTDKTEDDTEMLIDFNGQDSVRRGV